MFSLLSIDGIVYLIYTIIELDNKSSTVILDRYCHEGKHNMIKKYIEQANFWS